MTDSQTGSELVEPGPKHVAIIMDGNGRWAQQRGKPRKAGHRAGVKATRQIVQDCYEQGVKYLTLFAFSSENWGRPAAEVGFLMELFWASLQREVADLDKNGVRLRFIGRREDFEPRLQKEIATAEEQTASNDRLQLFIAVGYGGRADIVDGARALASRIQSGEIGLADITEDALSSVMALGDVPDPDLLIRTGGEQRISNFLIWNLAYAELYFSPALWPDFSTAELSAALEWYRARQRRFGLTGEQVTT